MVKKIKTWFQDIFRPAPVESLDGWLRRTIVYSSIPRAFLEALACTCLVILLTIWEKQVNRANLIDTIISIVAIFMFVFATRTTIKRGTLKQKIFYELKIFLFQNLFFAFILLSAGFYFKLLHPAMLRWQEVAQVAAGIFVGNIFFLLVYRSVLQFWVRIERLHHQYLRWRLTYAILFTIFVLCFLASVVGSFMYDPLYTKGEQGELPGVLIIFDHIMSTIIIGLIVLLFLLPPFAIFSFAVTKRITRRIEELAIVAKGLRSGNYDVRIVLNTKEKDEISQLQADFNAMAAALQSARNELEAEREKSERLLLNVLPEPIAARLKHNSSAIADSFNDATVLFADIVDFTKISARLSPEELVAWLNQIFSEFDGLAEKYGLEKIKTIGDAYMVVGGLPEPRPDHADAVAAMALEMQDIVARLNSPTGEPIRMRIGMNSGHVVAGVIGRRKFIYDIWGDAVNTASRMESHGIGGAIQVTDKTYQLLQPNFDLEERGLVQIKGKGEMQTYLLKGHKFLLAPDPVAA